MKAILKHKVSHILLHQACCLSKESVLVLGKAYS